MENKNINYWEFLGIPFNSSLADIKTAYLQKFNDIENSLDKGERTFTPYDLITVSKAYEVLSDTSKRIMHNCELGEKNAVLKKEYADLSDEYNELFNKWLLDKYMEYKSVFEHTSLIPSSPSWDVPIEVFGEIAEGLNNNVYNQGEDKTYLSLRKPSGK